MLKWEWDIEPMGAPRQTRADRWKQRPVVLRYHAFRDELRRLAKQGKFILPAAGMSLMFVIPMPKSLSKKERARRKWQPHQQKPDIDNLLKAFLDALAKEDSYVWGLESVQKVWGGTGEGKIIIWAKEPHELAVEEDFF